MVETVKLLKTFAYAVTALCSLISFGHVSEVCSIAGRCDGRVGAAIAFGVLYMLVSVAMLVLHMLAEQIANKVCGIAAHVLFVLIVPALGTSAAGLNLALLANFVAIILATLLCVYSWHTFDPSLFKKKKTESTVPEPSVTAEVPPPSVATAQV